MMENRLENQRQVASKPTQPPKGERSGHGVGVIKFALVVAMVVGFCGPAYALFVADEDYATVAMKFSLKDSMVERASERTVEGGESSEVTELWTFMRARGGNWLLSAIQQT